MSSDALARPTELEPTVLDTELVYKPPGVLDNAINTDDEAARLQSQKGQPVSGALSGTSRPSSVLRGFSRSWVSWR